MLHLKLQLFITLLRTRLQFTKTAHSLLSICDHYLHTWIFIPDRFHTWCIRNHTANSKAKEIFTLKCRNDVTGHAKTLQHSGQKGDAIWLCRTLIFHANKNVAHEVWKNDWNKKRTRNKNSTVTTICTMKTSLPLSNLHTRLQKTSPSGWKTLCGRIARPANY